MLKNKQFGRYAIIFCILGLFLNFFYSGFQTEHLNVLSNFLPASVGWDEGMRMAPNTYGGLAAVVLYLICGVALIKVGVRKIMVPSGIALSVFAIILPHMAMSGNYSGYFVCLFMVRLLVVPLQMGCFMMAANWFIKYRGRVMGIVTAGSPLFSIAGSQFMNRLAAAGQITTSYLILGIMCAVISLLCALLLKDTPEEAGLFPDGADHAPLSEHAEESEDVSLKEILTSKVGWQLIISYGIMQFVIVAMMAFMAARYISLGGIELWLGQGLLWLSVGAALGIPMSYVLGVIDDKLGSIKGSLVLNLLFFVAVIPLTIMPQGGNVALMITWAFGVACMTGGVPTMHPCVTSYVYGRKRYQAANKWIMTLQAIIMAFAPQYMASFFQAGNPNGAYYGLIIMLVISLITVISMWNVPDANAADRDYAKK